MNFRDILYALVTDRLIQAGTGTSSVSLLGAHGLVAHPLQPLFATLSRIQPWVAFFAALFGGLSAAAVFVYTCLKIWRLARNPRSVE